ncbi:hypothetical protein E4U41_003650, partial [Claviceps citrina]
HLGPVGRAPQGGFGGWSWTRRRRRAGKTAFQKGGSVLPPPPPSPPLDPRYRWPFIVGDASTVGRLALTTSYLRT